MSDAGEEWARPKSAPGNPPAEAAIRFGTDGWRGVIADDFTMANVRRAARALAAYVCRYEQAGGGVAVGYDLRFGSEHFARAAAEELARAGLRVWLAAEHTPTPVTSYAVRHYQAAAAVMITASHNPWQWNGFKVKASYGGSASPEIIARIEALLDAEVPARPGGVIHEADFRAPYLEQVRRLVNLEKIARAGFRLAVDPMYGAARGYLPALLQPYGIPCTEIHGRRDPLFPGINPEPIEPHVEELRRTVLEGAFDAGFALDGDGDRVGGVDRSGAFVDSHRIFAILLESLLERGRKGEVAKTFSASKMIDRIAAAHGMRLHETPIGFKYICDLMLERDILIGGEESGGIGVRGHLPERDGIVTSLLLAEAMADTGKTLGEWVGELHRRYGPQFYSRVDLHLPQGQKERALAALSEAPPAQIAGYPVSGIESLDGIKFLLEPNAWVLARGSGTEPLLRLYAEAPAAEDVQAILSCVEQMVRNA